MALTWDRRELAAGVGAITENPAFIGAGGGGVGDRATGGGVGLAAGLVYGYGRGRRVELEDQVLSLVWPCSRATPDMVSVAEPRRRRPCYPRNNAVRNATPRTPTLPRDLLWALLEAMRS